MVIPIKQSLNPSVCILLLICQLVQVTSRVRHERLVSNTEKIFLQAVQEFETGTEHSWHG